MQEAGKKTKVNVGPGMAVKKYDSNSGITLHS